MLITDTQLYDFKYLFLFKNDDNNNLFTRSYMASSILV